MNAQDLTHNLGGTWRGGKGTAPCPVCQPERRRDQMALSIAEKHGRTLIHCFKSQCNFVDIIQTAGGDLESVDRDTEAQSIHEEKRRAYEALQLQKAQSLWGISQPIIGTKAEAYLRARGICCDLPPALRFIPDLHHGPSMKWCMAMIAKASSGGVHRTFFDKRGERLKKNAKLMLGPCAGGAVRLSRGTGPLVVCEGIETGLSLMSGLLDDADYSVWAALSTSGIKALELPQDPQDLIVATDGDQAGREAGQRLASRASDMGWQVSMMPAPEGTDWNDQLKRKQKNVEHSPF